MYNKTHLEIPEGSVETSFLTHLTYTQSQQPHQLLQDQN